MVKINFNFSKILQVVLIVGIILFAILVFMWERDLYDDVRSWANINDLSDSERERMLKFYGCFNARHEITWRPILLQAVIITIVVAYICHQFTGKINVNMALIIGVSVFLIQYIFRSFRGFHLYAEMCDRIM